jgi:anti-anti-sigma factor
MSISTNTAGNETTITINGRFDFSLHKQFRDAYRDQASGMSYVVDMSGTDYMDSSALGMLLLLREHAGGDAAKISITGTKPDIRKILTISNFDKLFTIS